MDRKRERTDRGRDRTNRTPSRTLSPRLERRLEAYRSGLLSPRQRARTERWLERDAEARDELECNVALGRAVKRAWREGPPAPSPDRVLAAIRPAMRSIDAERQSPATLAGWLASWQSSLQGAALGLATASLALGVFVLAPPTDRHREAQHLVALPMQRGPVLTGGLQWPSSVYDLAQGDTPLVVYENEGATVIYLEEEPAAETGDLSLGSMAADWA